MSKTGEYVFTSESVMRGHPDKLCDQISDAIVGRYMRVDRLARVAAECATSAGIVFISVKALAHGSVDVSNIARSVIGNAGYDNEHFNPKTCAIMTSQLDFPQNGRFRTEEEHMSDAALDELTVSDQATVFGYACRHTPALLPLPIWLANKLARRVDEARESGELPYLAPDGKVQVAIEFAGRRPRRVHAITLVAAQREADEPSAARLADDLRGHVIDPVFADEEIKPDARTRIAVNPDGPIVWGGPYLHAGLTGHKGGADTYGEFARQSGSSLSGKDPSRVDRVGVYAARHVAKNVVAAGLAEQCEVQLTYSIGLAGPASVQVETFGTGTLAPDELTERVRQRFDFRLGAIVRDYKLRDLPGRSADGFFVRLATYGHVGRPELTLPWENVDRIEVLRA
jgi:S-adenosylmethionine synthetase